MIDIHTHILHALDDGPSTLDEADAMVRLAAENGTTDMVATPHANSAYPFDPQAIDCRIRELAEASDHVVRVHRGCDFHLNAPNIWDALDHPTKYTIDGGEYLLVEFSDFTIPPNIEWVFAEFRALGITPIVTHPERNPMLQRQISRLAEWVDNGCRLQVTAQSFVGDFGGAAQRCAVKLMDRRLVHFVASDAHDLTYRPPTLSPAYDWIVANYDREAAERLLVTNPTAVLASTAAG